MKAFTRKSIIMRRTHDEKIPRCVLNGSYETTRNDSYKKPFCEKVN